MELRAAARISGDRTMTEAFARGDDLHLLTASTLTGKPLSEVTKEERSAAKAVNFGSIFAASARGGLRHTALGQLRPRADGGTVRRRSSTPSAAPTRSCTTGRSSTIGPASSEASS